MLANRPGWLPIPQELHDVGGPCFSAKELAKSHPDMCPLGLKLSNGPVVDTGPLLLPHLHIVPPKKKKTSHLLTQPLVQHVEAVFQAAHALLILPRINSSLDSSPWRTPLGGGPSPGRQNPRPQPATANTRWRCCRKGLSHHLRKTQRALKSDRPPFRRPERGFPPRKPLKTTENHFLYVVLKLLKAPYKSISAR